MGATGGTGTGYPSGTPEFTPTFLLGLMLLDLLCVCYVDRYLILLYFFFQPLCCLSFDIRILITPLVSSNSSYSKVFMR